MFVKSNIVLLLSSACSSAYVLSRRVWHHWPFASHKLSVRWTREHPEAVCIKIQYMLLGQINELHWSGSAITVKKNSYFL
ncbi:hypothetical protein BD769DRAFT_1458622, partial [Suillus cothurnatus]